MKWGIVFASTSFPEPDRAAAVATIAEEAGFEFLCAPEHIAIPAEHEALYGASASGRLERPTFPDPLIWFAYVAAVTKRIKFTTGVMLLTERNALHTAKEAATLAMLSGDRLQLGVGVGWCREEYEALGVPWPNRGARMDEYIAALRLLWKDDEATFHGRFLNFDRVISLPKPPAGTIPIHIGGTSEAAARRAGRLGDGFFPAIFPTPRVYEDLPRLLAWVRESAVAAGRDPGAIEVTSGGVRTAEEAQWFAAQGVHRLTIAIKGKTIPAIRDELMAFSRDVIAKTRG